MELTEKKIVIISRIGALLICAVLFIFGYLVAPLNDKEITYKGKIVQMTDLKKLGMIPDSINLLIDINEEQLLSVNIEYNPFPSPIARVNNYQQGDTVKIKKRFIKTIIPIFFKDHITFYVEKEECNNFFEISRNDSSLRTIAVPPIKINPDTINLK